MVYLLIISFLILLVVNYSECGMDFLIPEVFFSFMNFISALVYGIVANIYGWSFCWGYSEDEEVIYEFKNLEGTVAIYAGISTKEWRKCYA